ncbi:extracellular solute-binding protein [Kitasatospora sp. NPDC058406]|uniref:extracellular solute-binding protein n=1 Tax=Kitasatospora sp. NPDC058406 TaxID=3346483 RepID=UPI003669673E
MRAPTQNHPPPPQGRTHSPLVNAADQVCGDRRTPTHDPRAVPAPLHSSGALTHANGDGLAVRRHGRRSQHRQPLLGELLLSGRRHPRLTRLQTSTQNTEAGCTAMTYMKSFYTDRPSAPATSALAGFIEGDVAMFCFYQSAISEIAAGNEKTKGKWVVAPMLAGPKNGCSMVGGHSLVASTAATNPAAAGTFMRWLASSDRSAQYMDFHVIFPYDTAKVTMEANAFVGSFYHTGPSWAAITTQLEPAPLTCSRNATASPPAGKPRKATSWPELPAACP